MGREGLFILNFVAQPNPLIYCRWPNDFRNSFPLLVEYDQSGNGQGPSNQFTELARLDLPPFLKKAEELKERDLTEFYDQFHLQGGFYDPDVRQYLANILNINLIFFFDSRVEEELRAFDRRSLDAPRSVLHRELVWWGLMRRPTIFGKTMVALPSLGPTQQQFEPALPVGQRW